MSIDLTKLTIKGAHEHMVQGDFTPLELAEAYLKEIEKSDKKLHAYLEVFEDVRDYAKTTTVKSENLLSGIPLCIKDNILIQGKIASSASRMLESYRAVYDATVIKKLKAEGALFLGRTNMDEFAMGSSTENSAFGPTKNPHDDTRVPGGTSGGSAAAIAAHMALGALGSDTGGSIRQPAALCGVVGLKPTYGAVSRYGIMAMGSSLDQIGPIAKTVEDTEILFNVLRGNDAFDSTSLPDSVWEDRKSTEDNFTIGVPWHLIEQEGIDADVLVNFKENIEKLKSCGYTIKDITLPHASYALAVYYIIMPAEVSTNLARYDGVKYGLHIDGDTGIDDYFKSRGAGFGKETRRRIILGTYVLSSGYYDAYYYKATEVRKLLRKEYQEAFSKVQAIVTPTTTSPAFKIGEKTDDPLKMYLEDIFTVSANIVGIPGISVPCGNVTREGVDLPLGLQIQANHAREDILFQVGKKFEGV